MTPSDEVNESIRKVELWGKRLGLKLPATFGTDLAEAHRSAGKLRDSVDTLLRESSTREDALAALADIEAWGIGDLLDHLRRLEETLAGVIEQLP